MLPSLQPNASKRAYVDQKATPFLISARYVTRQSNRERRTMSLGRRHVDPTLMCSHDPVDDVEPKSQVTSVARIASTALHRLKDPTHEFVRNGRTVVVHRDDYLVCLPTRRNPNRRFIRTVLYRIPDEIGHRLRQPGTVPYTVQFTARFDLELAVRIRSGNLGDHVVEHSRHVHLRTRDRDRVAEPRPREVQQIGHHLVHPPTALTDAVDELTIRLGQVAALQDELGRHDDRAKGRAKIMAEDGEESLLRVVDVLRVARERFGDRLVDGPVESDHLFELRPVSYTHLTLPT